MGDSLSVDTNVFVYKDHVFKVDSDNKALGYIVLRLGSVNVYIYKGSEYKNVKDLIDRLVEVVYTDEIALAVKRVSIKERVDGISTEGEDISDEDIDRYRGIEEYRATSG